MMNLAQRHAAHEDEESEEEGEDYLSEEDEVEAHEVCSIGTT